MVALRAIRSCDAVLDFRLCRKRRSLGKKQQWVEMRCKTFQEGDLDVRTGYYKGIYVGARNREVSGREAAQALLILRAGSEEEHINLRLALPCAVGAG